MSSPMGQDPSNPLYFWQMIHKLRFAKSPLPHWTRELSLWRAFFLLRNMATGSISILLPNVPLFHKFHPNAVEHQGPISCLCIWFTWVAGQCQCFHKQELKQESWASGEAQVHGFKHGTNITCTSRLWRLSPCSAEQSRIRYQRDNSQEGQSTMVTEPCAAQCLLSRREREIEKYAMTAASTFFLFPSLSLPHPFNCHYLWDCTHTSMGPSTRSENWKQAKGSGHSVLPKI